MATYAIGDVQGCYDQLMRLLQRCGYDERRDRLWFVGDLVNRGPQSLATVRFVKGLGDCAVTVLGNHDLSLLVVAEGAHKGHASDTFGDILGAPDREELLHWLRRQNLMHAEGGYAMVHAGLLPQWSIDRALELARETEAALRGPACAEFLRNLYGNQPARWRDELAGYDRLRIIVNAMTRMRLVTADGTMQFSHKLGLANAPAGYVPWYDAPARASHDTRVIFGHWAALGLLVRDDVVCLDSGCVWGRKLSALRLEDRQLIQCDCAEMNGKAHEE
ncbi:MAG: symmetrical bis(5'-nucleosyl)-tetraphosphatase [Betaproteobacteria bacterium]|nr:symmetrical bis(5'-nucleosyl)-tetraphosphatase [Betaproteobacteria bacterium]MDH3437558.1 symmetrical bis(5'-nucleosyl)-tetraphosphatase [Betaproteobacteria bacterium]